MPASVQATACLTAPYSPSRSVRARARMPVLGGSRRQGGGAGDPVPQRVGGGHVQVNEVAGPAGLAKSHTRASIH